MPGPDGGEIAVLSATSTAPNQNAWIEVMKEELKKPEYSKLELVEVVYGDDDDTKSYNEAQALFTKYPDLKVIIAPTTVGIAAAARAVTDANLIGKVFVTGLGTPNQMREYVKNGAAPQFALWNPADLVTLPCMRCTRLQPVRSRAKQVTSSLLANLAITPLKMILTLVSMSCLASRSSGTRTTLTIPIGKPDSRSK